MPDNHIRVFTEGHRPVENGVYLLPVDRRVSSPVGTPLLHIGRRLVGHEDPGHRWVPEGGASVLLVQLMKVWHAMEDGISAKLS